MSLICFETNTQHILFNKWISEVHEKAKIISGQQNPAYLVYVDEDEYYDTYVYFLISLQHPIRTSDTECVGNMKVIYNVNDCKLPLQSTPVHCNPTTDMSTMSLAKLIYLCPLIIQEHDLYEYAIEDITIEKLILQHESNNSHTYTHNFQKCGSMCVYAGSSITNLNSQQLPPSTPDVQSVDVHSKTMYHFHNILHYSHDYHQKLSDVCGSPEYFDNDIKSMFMFVNLAFDHADPGKLVSYIKQTLITRQYMNEDELDVFPASPPLKYTMLEVRSEMMKCNKSLYTAYKQKLLNIMLLSIVEDSRSNAEMEHNTSGLIYEILFDSVVNCMNTLWCFIDGVWKECSTDGYIWNFITTEFMEYLKSQGESVQKIVMHMMSVTIRSRMMKDIKMRLQDDNFYVLLDSKRNIIRMTNGVYDTITGILSDPVPSDYVSVITGVPYQIFDDNSAHLTKLMRILGSIFPDPEILKFFILSCCTFIEGYNSPKVFYIWWGAGNNAKSLVQTLVMKTFGEYCSTAPTSLVTGKSTESSNATPDLCHVERKLVVFLQEPNPDEKIKAGKMKEMTGNDSMYVRQLFKSGKTMTLKAKLVIVCNNIIEIPGMDAAIKRRIVVLPFTSTFLDPAEYQARRFKGNLEPNSNIIDLSVEKDLLSCKSAFMYLICRRYSEWVSNENMFLNVPFEIKRVTDEYITKNNYPLKFIRKYLHSVNVPGQAIAATEIYELFKDWFRRGYPGKKVHDFEKFTKELSDEGYKSDDNGAILEAFVSYNGDN